MASHLIYKLQYKQTFHATDKRYSMQQQLLKEKKYRFGLYYIVELLNSDYTLVGLLFWTRTPCSSCLTSTITSLFIT